MNKPTKVILIILIIAALIGWVRQGQDIGHIARSLPFCGGRKPGLYDVGGLAMLGLCLWGLSRLRNAGKDEDSDDDAAMEDVQEAPEPEDNAGASSATPDEDPDEDGNP